MSVLIDPAERGDPQVEKLFYYGQEPWHGLGTKVDHALTSEEAIVEAGLDWEVDLKPVYTTKVGKNIPQIRIPNKWAVQRQSDGSVYAVVGNFYQPIQNRDAFKFFDDVIGQGGGKYETAGSLYGGAKIWILMRMEGSVWVEDDQVDKYLILSNSHDATQALRMFYSPIRVVCRNTLRIAKEQMVGDSFYSRHTTKIMARVEEAKALLKVVDKYYEDFEAQARFLASRTLPAPKLQPLLLTAFGQPDGRKWQDVYTPLKVEMEKVPVIIERDREKEFSPKLHGTAWEAYNGIVKYTDYYRDYNKGTEDDRLSGVWFAGGQAIKEKAWNFLMKEVS